MALTSLDPGTTYQVRVVAKNGDGFEAPAVWQEFTTMGVGTFGVVRMGVWCAWLSGVHGGVDSLNGVGEWYRQISDDIMKIIYDDIIFITSAG